LKNFQKNLIFAFSAQLISMLMSMLLSLVLPKFLGVEQYAYWQLFILYSGYVGFFHFGLSDGLYLRYGGVNRSEMNKDLIGSQFRFMIIWQVAISILIVLFIPFIIHDDSRLFVWIVTAIFLVIANATWCMGFIFQAANETRIYSIATIISKLLAVLFIIMLFLFKIYDFKLYIVAYVLAQLISSLYCLFKGKEFVLSKWVSLKTLLYETRKNISIGIKLTFANIASSLILGTGKIFVDHFWGINSFGVLSLSISLVNFILQFISQASMVFFPELRQSDEKKQYKIYNSLDNLLGILLCGALIFYSPCCWLVSNWLPSYADSLTYLAIILPICVFDGKMQLLYSTFMKVYRKEKSLLILNVGSCILCVLLCFFLTFVIKSIIAVAFAMLIAIVVRNLISSVYLVRVMKLNMNKIIFVELFLCTIFILLNNTLPLVESFIIYMIIYIAVLIILLPKIKRYFFMLKNR